MAEEPKPTSDANDKQTTDLRAEFAEVLRPRGKVRYSHETGEKAGDFLGPYKLLDILGEGGFGRVWLAERREPHVQRVALKVIKPGMDTANVIARFEQERQALAVMDHPNVAKVFDAGTTANGRPYFVMEFVQGEPITDYCDRQTLTTKQRLDLFIPVCEAVQHAHMKGIIHRDIKPTNVLVTVKDGTPMPKVIDFGVAKAISRVLTDKTLFTLQGQLIGTPEYMSPEQAEMSGTDIDTRTDVYSLGVVLYELLTGLLPFEPGELRSKGYAEIQRIIREVDPPKAGTRLSAAALKSGSGKSGSRGRGSDARTHEPSRPRGSDTEAIDYALGQAEKPAGEVEDAPEVIARRHRTDVDALVKELKRELEWIPLKAMEKDRTRRYSTPKELADDIRNYLAGKPLAAGPESVGYRMRKFVRKNRGVLAAVGAVFLAVLAGLAGTGIGMVKAIAARERAESSADRAERAIELFGSLASVLGPAQLGSASERAAQIRWVISSVDESADKLSIRDEVRLRVMLASAIYFLGDAATAESQYRRAIEIQDESAPPSSRVDLMISLASILSEQGRFSEAVPLLQSAKDLNAARGSDVLLSGRICNEIGAAMNRQADYPGSLDVFREAVAIFEAAGATRTADGVGARHNLAITLQRLGDLPGAEREMRRAVEDGRRVWPSGGLLLSKHLCDFGVLIGATGRRREGAAMLADALRMACEAAPVDAPLPLEVRREYLFALLESGDFEKTELEAKQLRIVARKASDEFSERVAEAMLGQAWREQGRLAESREALMGVIASADRVSDQRFIATTRNALAETLCRLGELVEAERQARASLEHRLAMFGPDHPRKHETTSVLGEILGKMNDRDGALALVIPAAEAIAARGGLSPWRSKHVYERAADLLEVMGRTTDAELWKERAKATTADVR